ncbi:CPBP family intramembrane metalloprotease [bacterium]|nr:CPBP family intramembrane metalloprotease [bacterium]
MKLRWPPEPLGFGTLLNLALKKETGVPLIRRTLWQAAILGLTAPLVMLMLDQILFSGVSLDRIRLFGSQPPLVRLVIILYSSITEELIHRLGIATLCAWVTFLITRPYVQNAKAVSQWTGIVIAAVLFGLSHVANMPNVAHPILRAVTLNGFAGLILGWLYWWRGLESAIAAHLIADAVLYFLVPPFL